uniref:Uncharacterized protein n=1 Tax=Arundo donax TaxID=35708 RepID=A0A0A9C7Q9_ARUDO
MDVQCHGGHESGKVTDINCDAGNHCRTADCTLIGVLGF